MLSVQVTFLLGHFLLPRCALRPVTSHSSDYTSSRSPLSRLHGCSMRTGGSVRGVRVSHQLHLARLALVLLQGCPFLVLRVGCFWCLVFGSCVFGCASQESDVLQLWWHFCGVALRRRTAKINSTETVPPRQRHCLGTLMRPSGWWC